MEAGCTAFVTDDRDFGPDMGIEIVSWDRFEIAPRLRAPAETLEA